MGESLVLSVLQNKTNKLQNSGIQSSNLFYIQTGTGNHSGLYQSAFLEPGVRDVAQWESACLASAGPAISPQLQEKTKQNKPT